MGIMLFTHCGTSLLDILDGIIQSRPKEVLHL